VIHSRTEIGNRVKIYPGVTIGRADIYLPMEQSQFKGIIIEDDAILCPEQRFWEKKG
jgi:serine O-acetyltransferase